MQIVRACGAGHRADANHSTALHELATLPTTLGAELAAWLLAPEQRRGGHAGAGAPPTNSALLRAHDSGASSPSSLHATPRAVAVTGYLRVRGKIMGSIIRRTD
jgi:hypothetical protein